MGSDTGAGAWTLRRDQAITALASTATTAMPPSSHVIRLARAGAAATGDVMIVADESTLDRLLRANARSVVD